MPATNDVETPNPTSISEHQAAPGDITYAKPSVTCPICQGDISVIAWIDGATISCPTCGSGYTVRVHSSFTAVDARALDQDSELGRHYLDRNGNRRCLDCDAFVRPNATAPLHASKALAVANAAIQYAAREASRMPPLVLPDRPPRTQIGTPDVDRAVITFAWSSMLGVLFGWLAPITAVAAILVGLALGYLVPQSIWDDPLAGHSAGVRRMTRRW